MADSNGNSGRRRMRIPGEWPRSPSPEVADHEPSQDEHLHNPNTDDNNADSNVSHADTTSDDTVEHEHVDGGSTNPSNSEFTDIINAYVPTPLSSYSHIRDLPEELKHMIFTSLLDHLPREVNATDNSCYIRFIKPVLESGALLPAEVLEPLRRYDQKISAMVDRVTIRGRAAAQRIWDAHQIRGEDIDELLWADDELDFLRPQHRAASDALAWVERWIAMGSMPPIPPYTVIPAPVLMRQVYIDGFRRQQAEEFAPYEAEPPAEAPPNFWDAPWNPPL